jgi:hypothetical protein
VRQLLVIANVLSSSILVTPMEALRSSETSDLTTATRRNILEEGIVEIKKQTNVLSEYDRKSNWLNNVMQGLFVMNLTSKQVTASILSSLILLTLMMDSIRSSETPVLIRATQHHIPEDDIFKLLASL